MKGINLTRKVFLNTVTVAGVLSLLAGAAFAEKLEEVVPELNQVKAIPTTGKAIQLQLSVAPLPETADKAEYIEILVSSDRYSYMPRLHRVSCYDRYEREDICRKSMLIKFAVLSLKAGKSYDFAVRFVGKWSSRKKRTEASQISNMVTVTMPDQIQPDPVPEKVPVTGITPKIEKVFLNNLVEVPDWLARIFGIKGYANITVKVEPIQADAQSMILFRSLDNGKTFERVKVAKCRYSLGKGHWLDICRKNPTASYEDVKVKVGDRVLYKVQFHGYGHDSNFSAHEVFDIQKPESTK